MPIGFSADIAVLFGLVAGFLGLSFGFPMHVSARFWLLVDSLGLFWCLGVDVASL